MSAPTRPFDSLDAFLTALTNALADHGADSTEVRDLMESARGQDPEWEEVALTAVGLRRVFERRRQEESGTTLPGPGVGAASFFKQISLALSGACVALLVALLALPTWLATRPTTPRDPTTALADSEAAGRAAADEVLTQYLASVESNPSKPPAGGTLKSAKLFEFLHASGALAGHLSSNDYQTALITQDDRSVIPTAFVGRPGSLVPLPVDSGGAIEPRRWTRLFAELTAINAMVQKGEPVKAETVAARLAPIYREAAQFASQREMRVELPTTTRDEIETQEVTGGHPRPSIGAAAKSAIEP